jgi:arylsulfatase A-like enzyme
LLEVGEARRLVDMAKDRPNLLFLYTDEQRYDTMAAYGNTQIDMPNLNRFARDAVVFDEAYVTQPVCTPSRSSLLTGQYPHTNGCTKNNVPLRPDTKCVPEMLGGDYVCGHFGKWHLGDEIYPQHGFSEWRGIEDGYRTYYSSGRDRKDLSDYQKWLRDVHGRRPPDGKEFFSRMDVTRLPEEMSKPAFLAEQSSAFLSEHASDNFALFVNFLEPHMPFFSPRDHQYDPESIPLPPNFEVVPDDSCHPRTRANMAKWREQYPSERAFRELIARYWGLCSLVDTHVGVILDTLESLGLAENTIVVYTSDHGDMMGSHQEVAKTVQYQESVRVPLLIRLPQTGGGEADGGETDGAGARAGGPRSRTQPAYAAGTNAGGTNAAGTNAVLAGAPAQGRVYGPVSQIDVVPTLLDLMGQDIPDYLEGVSRAEVVRKARRGGANREARSRTAREARGGERESVGSARSGSPEGADGGGPSTEVRLRDDVFIEWNPDGNTLGATGDEEARAAAEDSVRTIVTADGWRYSHSAMGYHELFNLRDDPLETKNRAGDPMLASLREELARKIKAWQIKTNDGGHPV